jgi:hypothetical protein
MCCVVLQWSCCAPHGCSRWWQSRLCHGAVSRHVYAAHASGSGVGGSSSSSGGSGGGGACLLWRCCRRCRWRALLAACSHISHDSRLTLLCAGCWRGRPAAETAAAAHAAGPGVPESQAVARLVSALVLAAVGPACSLVVLPVPCRSRAPSPRAPPPSPPPWAVCCVCTPPHAHTNQRPVSPLERSSTGA